MKKPRRPPKPRPAPRGTEEPVAGPAKLRPAWWRKDWFAGFLLVALTFLAYQPVWQAGFIWDDDTFLTDNPVIKSADGLYRLWFTAATPDYFPMTSSLLWLEWHLWGNYAPGYHLVNILLQASSAVLLWRVLRHLKIPGALLAAAIFAVHPVNVESVAWITEGKNTLAMLFFAATLLCWLKFEESGRGRWYGLALGGFALALLSKTAAAPLPVVLLGLAWWRRGRVDGRDGRRVVPFFVLAGALAVVTVWFQYHHSIGHDVVRTDGFWSRLAGAGRAVWFYLYKAVLPLNLSFVYPRWQIEAGNLLSYLPLALLAGALVLCWRARRSWGRALFFGLGYFVVMLLPVLGFLNIYFMRYSLVADHWEYFAIIGPIALAAAVIRRPVPAAALVLVLGVLTWMQCGMYANVETLWRATIASNPACWLGRNNLGYALSAKGDRGGAIEQYQKALDSNPDYAEASYNLGNELAGLGKLDEAIAEYRKAVTSTPDYVAALNNLGIALDRKGADDEAIAQYEKALAISSENAETLDNLGNALAHKGATEAAIGQYQKALKIQPGFALAHYNLANALMRLGKLDAGIAQYQAALAIVPDNSEVLNNLANALANKGDFETAVAQFQKAIAIKPDQIDALNNLAWLLATTPKASLRNGTKAVALAAQANQLTGGGNPMILHTLAAVYAEAGSYGTAAVTARRALDLVMAQKNNALAGMLQKEIQLYEANKPLQNAPQ